MYETRGYVQHITRIEEMSLNAQCVTKHYYYYYYYYYYY